MNEIKPDFEQAASVDTERAECEPIMRTEVTEIIKEEKAMYELENDVLVEYGDRTYRTEHELNRFLSTLTEAQLAETEVLVDDETFVVFYPLLVSASEGRAERLSGYHFDSDSLRPTVAAADVPELVGIFADQSQPFNSPCPPDRAAALAVLLASVRL